jgi:hypothetical protein
MYLLLEDDTFPPHMVYPLPAGCIFSRYSIDLLPGEFAKHYDHVNDVGSYADDFVLLLV